MFVNAKFTSLTAFVLAATSMGANGVPQISRDPSPSVSRFEPSMLSSDPRPSVSRVEPSIYPPSVTPEKRFFVAGDDDDDGHDGNDGEEDGNPIESIITYLSGTHSYTVTVPPSLPTLNPRQYQPYSPYSPYEGYTSSSSSSSSSTSTFSTTTTPNPSYTATYTVCTAFATYTV